VIDPDARGRAETVASSLDPGLTGQPSRPVPGVENGYIAGYRVRFDEAGPDGILRTSNLLRYAQDVAWRHSEALGFGRDWYAERGLGWVVRSVDLVVLGPIAMGETVRVSTAVAGHRRIWARRLSEARHADGRLAARIVTDWVLLDGRGRLVRIPADFGLSFTNPELSGEILRAETAAQTAGRAAAPPTTIRFRVRPHDLDPVGHVNNASYLDWLEEGLLVAGLPSLVGDVPRGARLEYLASAGPDDEVVVTTQPARSGVTGTIMRGTGEELLRASFRGSPSEVATPIVVPIEGIPPA
jgi:acyl-CoA thioesterase FadM